MCRHVRRVSKNEKRYTRTARDGSRNAGGCTIGNFGEVTASFARAFLPALTIAIVLILFQLGEDDRRNHQAEFSVAKLAGPVTWSK